MKIRSSYPSSVLGSRRAEAHRASVHSYSLILLGLVLAGFAGAALGDAARVPAGPLREGIIQSEFVGAKPPTPFCHASTIAETPNGIVVAWYGGSKERAPDTAIWMARMGAGGWSDATEIANGAQADGGRFPSWNPVLFQAQKGPLLLFYRIGPGPRGWWGVLATSADAGKTWTAAERLPESILGPVKNKPVELGYGVLLCPSSSEYPTWQVRMELTGDLGNSWQQLPPLNDGKKIQAIQPTVLKYPSGRIQILCRSKEGQILESWSEGLARVWSPLQPTALPNPDSGIDGVVLKDGRALLVYNHAERERTPLNVAISADGKTWQAALVLESEPGEYSYPAVIQTSDGLVHITYSWRKERIKHVVVDPAKLAPRAMREGRWPPE